MYPVATQPVTAVWWLREQESGARNKSQPFSDGIWARQLTFLGFRVFSHPIKADIIISSSGYGEDQRRNTPEMCSSQSTADHARHDYAQAARSSRPGLSLSCALGPLCTVLLKRSPFKLSQLSHLVNGGLKAACTPPLPASTQFPKHPQSLATHTKDISPNDLIGHGLKFILHLLQERLHL